MASSPLANGIGLPVKGEVQVRPEGATSGQRAYLPLSALADLKSGGTPSKSDPRYWGGDIPWLTPKDMGDFNGETQNCVTPQAIGNGTRIAPANCVFVAVRGMSLHNEIRVVFASRPMSFNQDIKAVVAKGTDPKFLYYVLTAAKPALLAMVESAGHGTGVLPTDRIAGLPVPQVPPPEQSAIARILGSLDELIELNRRTSKTLRDLARALFRDWFIDFGPVRAKAEGRDRYMSPHLWAMFPSALCDSPLGQSPVTWTPSTLKHQTTKIGSGATPRGGKAVYVDRGVALIRSQNVYDDDFVWDGLARITDEAAEQLAGVELQIEDVLLNITGASILRTCVVNPSVLPARVNQHVAIIRAREGVSPRFLHLHLMQEKTKNYLLGMNAGGSREAVTKAHIESVPLLMPSPALLEEFGKVVAPMYQHIDELAAESRTLANCRDQLLPKLISGDIRIKDADRFIEEATA